MFEVHALNSKKNCVYCKIWIYFIDITKSKFVSNYISQEYILPDVKDRQHLITLHKSAKKAGVNLAEYNDIKRKIAEIEHDLRRLRDPLYMHLPAPPPKSPNFSATEIATSKKLLQEALETASTNRTVSKQTASKISSLLEGTGSPFRSKK